MVAAKNRVQRASTIMPRSGGLVFPSLSLERKEKQVLWTSTGCLGLSSSWPIHGEVRHARATWRGVKGAATVHQKPEARLLRAPTSTANPKRPDHNQPAPGERVKPQAQPELPSSWSYQLFFSDSDGLLPPLPACALAPPLPSGPASFVAPLPPVPPAPADDVSLISSSINHSSPSEFSTTTGRTLRLGPSCQAANCTSVTS